MRRLEDDVFQEEGASAKLRAATDVGADGSERYVERVRQHGCPHSYPDFEGGGGNAMMLVAMVMVRYLLRLRETIRTGSQIIPQYA